MRNEKPENLVIVIRHSNHRFSSSFTSYRIVDHFIYFLNGININYTVIMLPFNIYDDTNKVTR